MKGHIARSVAKRRAYWALALTILAISTVVLWQVALPTPSHAGSESLLYQCWLWYEEFSEEMGEQEGEAAGGLQMEVCVFEAGGYSSQAEVWAQNWTQNPQRWIDYQYVVAALKWEGSELGNDDDDCSSCWKTDTVDYWADYPEPGEGDWRAEGYHYFDEGTWHDWVATWIQCHVSGYFKPSCSQGHS